MFEAPNTLRIHIMTSSAKWYSLSTRLLFRLSDTASLLINLKQILLLYHKKRDSSRGSSVNSDTHQFSLRSLLESASAAVSQTSSHTTVISSFDEEQVPLPFNFASSSHISSPSNSSSSNPTDELQSQSSGYHPRDEVDNDYSRPSDSDSDLRLSKRPRIARPFSARRSMRINKKENGVGNSANGVLPTSNGDSSAATNGKASEFTKMTNNRQQELVRLMVQAMQDMGYRLVYFTSN
ncbi:14645_t:CDS:2 [Acaulospora morrowiae]|uniref:14645_t:CDS:1 n=1 Tax=Acaulospora morrowiae TaxID=94023 RepID=A0A9N9CBJ7_9GLOM|nr:14645_t:CDS:2 [Acaulospora morrowiae]